jgi:hypothetical protein
LDIRIPVDFLSAANACRLLPKVHFMAKA